MWSFLRHCQPNIWSKVSTLIDHTNLIPTCSSGSLYKDQGTPQLQSLGQYLNTTSPCRVTTFVYTQVPIRHEYLCNNTWMLLRWYMSIPAGWHAHGGCCERVVVGLGHGWERVGHISAWTGLKTLLLSWAYQARANESVSTCTTGSNPPFKKNHIIM